MEPSAAEPGLRYFVVRFSIALATALPSLYNVQENAAVAFHNRDLPGADHVLDCVLGSAKERRRLIDGEVP